jgi:hypothetical protein
MFGGAATWAGFVVRHLQMIETTRSESVAALLDGKRNFLIGLFHPVLEIADQLGDYGFPLFLLLVVLNTAVWALAVFVVIRLFPRRRSAERSPAV